MLNYVAFNKDAACQLVDIVTDRFTGAIDDYDYVCAKVFSEILDAIMHGESSCLVHNYGYSQETKRVIRETLESLGYETESYSGQIYKDFAFRVIWRKPKEIKPVYGIPNIRFDKDTARADEVMAQWAKLAEARKKGDQNDK